MTCKFEASKSNIDVSKLNFIEYLNLSHKVFFDDEKIVACFLTLGIFNYLCYSQFSFVILF